LKNTNDLRGNSWLHFKIHRFIEYLKFYPNYIYHKLFHEQSTHWESWKGALLCDCGYAIDLGYSYGQHCESCWNRMIIQSKGVSQ